MDNFQQSIKETRELRWQNFGELSSDEKIQKLAGIILCKLANDAAPLPVNLRNPGSNFDSIIFALISKAQNTPDNYYRLMLAFPEYVSLWEEWQNTQDEEDFFKEYNC